MEIIHKPVLLKESIENLNIKEDGTYVDCTLGDGGYSLEILKKLKKGILYSLEVDDDSIEFVKEKYKEFLGDKWKIIKSNFSDIQKSLNNIGIDGAVFDLGLSSRQIEASGRGFSFIRSEDLDMRMDKELNVKAQDLLKALSEKELEKLFRLYGEERFSKRIARSIKRWTKENTDQHMTTEDLVKLIRRVVPAGYRDGSKHPARRVFQALRIAVNDEQNTLRAGLSSALSMLNNRGRVVVVSYHSLEDRIAKNLFKEANNSGNYEVITSKPIVPGEEEVRNNVRARSAKLRVIEKIK
ncbi:MAG: 16S rRNA (cytosine(1402)-N(4))-methyltransferase RsmH [bacterium]